MDSVYKDGETFRPERWLDGSVDTSTRQYSGWGHMLAFSDGPRNCIGTRLGEFALPSYLLMASGELTVVHVYGRSVADEGSLLWSSCVPNADWSPRRWFLHT